MEQCVKCGTLRVHLAASLCEMCNTPFTVPAQDSSVYPNQIPWEQPVPENLMVAFYNTIYPCLFKPYRFFSLITESTSLFKAWLFALTCSSIGILLNLLWNEKAIFLSSFSMSNTMSGVGETITASELIFSPVIISSLLILVSAYVCIMLFLARARSNTFKHIMTIVCYAQGAALFTGFPVIGNTLYSIWFLVLLVLGISKGCAISKVRTVATLLFPFLFVFSILFIIVFVLTVSLFMLDSLVAQILPSLQ